MASFQSTTRAFCRTFAVIAAFALLGCASPRTVVPQQSMASDLRSTIGLPTDIRFDANGDELWEYAKGPSGTETYLVRVGRDGKVKDVTQLLTTARFDRIVPGKTTKAEVRDLLGRPSDIEYLKSGLVWEWRVLVQPAKGFFNVRFDDNNIVRDKIVLMDWFIEGGSGSPR